MEDDGSGKDDLEGETHTVWQILHRVLYFYVY